MQSSTPVLSLGMCFLQVTVAHRLLGCAATTTKKYTTADIRNGKSFSKTGQLYVKKQRRKVRVKSKLGSAMKIALPCNFNSDEKKEAPLKMKQKKEKLGQATVIIEIIVDFACTAINKLSLRNELF